MKQSGLHGEKPTRERSLPPRPGFQRILRPKPDDQLQITLGQDFRLAHTSS